MLNEVWLFHQNCINPLVPNALLLYPPGNIRKSYGLMMFSWGRERVHWEQMA